MILVGAVHVLVLACWAGLALRWVWVRRQRATRARR